MIDDNTIMNIVKSGDKKVFEELVIRHRLKALRFAPKYVKEEFIAEDIIQDSFALIYVKRMEYNNTYSFKTFLYTVIRNKCIDYLRKQKLVNIDDIKLRTPSAEDIVPDELEIIKQQYIITGMIMLGDSISIRVISDVPPSDNAQICEPNIEDSYMLMIGGIDNV